MGLLPSRQLLMKILLFMCIYASMMMYRRLQLASCKESKMLHHSFPRIAANQSSSHKKANRFLDISNYDASKSSKGRLSEYLENVGGKGSMDIGNPGVVINEDNSSLLYDIIWTKKEVLFDLPDTVKNEYSLVLSVNADGNKTILIAIVDETLQEFALNFYISSLQKHSISNYLFICLDSNARLFLETYDIDCLLYELPNIKVSDSRTKPQNQHVNQGDFGSAQYFTKTNVKTLLVLEALKLGYHVLISDVDVIFFQNPFPYLTCSDCDLLVSMDREYWNTGFVFVHPTTSTTLLYTRTWKLYNHYHLTHDQAYLHMARKTLLEDKIALTAIELSSKMFPCGYYYFQEVFREFANEPKCPQCITVHNNYLGSSAAKRYRFQENLLWAPDVNQYYSNTSAKYLTYANPMYVQNDMYELELKALQSAMFLGHVLGRAVILPKFHCCNCKSGACYSERYKCSLLHMINVQKFDDMFKGKYREHSFLAHQNVPSHLKSATSVTLRLPSEQSKAYGNATQNEPVHIYQMKDNQPADMDSFPKWMDSFVMEPIIAFESLYGDYYQLFDQSEFQAFKDKTKSAFECSEYEQWQVKFLGD